jgi:hypothetical protein
MPRKSTRLNPERLRELAIAGAELALKQLRAEIDEPDAADVGHGATRGVRAHEEVLG